MSTYEPVYAGPVKRFFVTMLTRDISIEDAILDLLDNCVDGIIRSKPNNKSETPYRDFWARITVNKNVFQIEDNCGGIPWDEHDRAFRMGRPHNPTKGKSAASVGVYGIGMKRAIFKMGNEASIWTQNKKNNYVVPISQEWINTEEDWDLEVLASSEAMDEDGTRITITKLHRGISERFSAENFDDDLLDKIQNHYAMILRKGFSVSVNGIDAKPTPMELRFAMPDADQKSEIRPYVFKTTLDGVQVFLSVGLREPIPGIEDVKFKSEYAGWTVICNDRVVLYCDKSELTGWGTAGIPQYHTQFIAISGIVEFYGDPRKLPTTTTKRGLEYGNPLYIQVLERMREGMSLFTDFTNKWKTREKEANAIIDPTPSLAYPQLKLEAKKIKYSKTRVGIEGEFYKPKLPMPPNDAADVRISYIRKRDDVYRLAEELFDVSFDNDSEREVARRVGEASFDFTYNHFFEKK